MLVAVRSKFCTLSQNAKILLNNEFCREILKIPIFFHTIDFSKMRRGIGKGSSGQ